MRYLSCCEYEKIYQRYINPDNVYQMMSLAGDYQGKSFLDLCCGGGAATQDAIRRGASFCAMVDQEKRMIPDKFFKSDNIEIFDCSIFQSFYQMEQKIPSKQFDIVFCRQGVNYWLNPKMIELLDCFISPGGVFIFNTFNTKPSKEPVVKEYKIRGVSFVEVSYIAGIDVVYHIQIREGYEPHMTQFGWISEEKFRQSFGDKYDIEIVKRGKTDIYKCVKK
jgi:SAM-dependent methyltransferase